MINNNQIHLYSIILLSFLISSCGSVVKQTGQASWYGNEYDGRKTASGEIFHQNRLTAAHKTLPFGTRLKVKNLTNGKTVKVRVNDRGPFVKGRILDLSKGAAKKVDMINQGVAQVEIRYKKKKK